MVENGQVGGGVARRVEQGGDQPAAARGVPGAGGDGDLGVDDPDGNAAEARQPGPVGKAAQDREPGGAAAGADPDQEVRPGSRDLRGQEPGAEAAVGELSGGPDNSPYAGTAIMPGMTAEALVSGLWAAMGAGIIPGLRGRRGACRAAGIGRP